MNRSYTRLLSFLLSLLICLSMLPVGTFAADVPTEWPKLSELTLNEGAQLVVKTAGAPESNNREIKKVSYENYSEPKLISEGDTSSTYSVGKVTLQINAALSSDWTYKISDGALSKNFTAMPDGVTATDKFEPVTISPNQEIKGRAFAKSDAYSFIYEYELVVGPTAPTEWPKLSELTLNEGAQLVVKTAGAPESNNREIKKVSYENYSEPKLISEGDTSSTYSVGKVTLQINAALSSDWTYKISDGALSKNFTAMPDGVTATDKFEPVTISPNQEIKGRAFAKSDAYSFIYEYELVVGAPAVEHDYPVITELSLSPNAVLTGADSSTVTIVAATFENYEDAQDIAGSSTKKTSGKVTLYVLKELSNQKYKLAAQTVNATYSEKEGFTTNYLQGSIPAGATSSVSSSYATNDESRVRYCYNLEVVVGYPDNGMYVVEGSASRITPTKARVTFTASKAGIFHYACVDAASTDVPDMPTGGATMTAGENTFVIDGLTEGAKRVYIWGGSVEGTKSQPLVVDVSADAVTYSLLLEIQSVGTDGVFRITANGQDVSFGNYYKIYTRASDCLYEGDVVTVWMGNPYTDKDLKSVTLIPLGSSEALDVQVDSAANSFTFTMPAANVNGKDSWRTYEESTETRYTLTGTSSTFDQTNKAGIAMGSVVFKDEAGNIIKQAMTGTTVTATPVPSTTANYMLEFGFVEWSDAVGFNLGEADKTNSPLTFTVGTENVSLKANFEPVGTLVTWGAKIEPATTASDVPVVSFGSNLMTSPYTFKAGQDATASISGTEWYARYEFLGWEITRNGQALPAGELDTSQVVGTEGKPGYWTVPRFTVSGVNMSIIAKFRQRNWGAVNVSVNDSAMGSAAATVNGKADVSQVFEDQTVTLTANPGERYMLEGWTVTDKDQQPIEVTTSADNANVATFVMPEKGGDVTAIANFKVNPDNASKDAVMTKAELYTYEEPKKLVASGSKEGTLFTITLASDVDTTHLSSMILKFAYSEHAKVMQGTTEWPADGQACGMALNEEKIFTVIAEDGTSKCDYTVKIVQQPKLSSEKAITSVELIYNNETFASGELNEATSTWTITLDDDIDPTILSKFGTMDIKMKITYNGASLAQEGGYNDVGQTSWSSGTISCGVSPGSQKTFTVTAEDGSTKDYIIAITQPSVSDKPVVSNGDATRTSDKEATVTFTSSVAGSYYYKVVASGAAEPDIDTSKSGSAAVAGSNTITLNNLTAGARDIYIVVKNAAGDVSNKLKIAIPAFGEDPDKPDEGNFKITYTGPSGGKLVPSRTKANAGDVITVTVVPDAGMQMVAGSMKYTLGVAGGESTTITDGTFTMPSADVTLSCKWEAVKTSTDGITGFVIDGVAGVVDNTTNTISVVMAYGTDVTKLIPIISGNNIASISPASGQMVDFTNSVRYTVTLTDGTVKYYTVTVYVQEGTAADKMWDKLTDFYDQTPWWEYADHQVSTGHYPKYW